jgi:nucleoside-diphosphate-sugar epimerase
MATRIFVAGATGAIGRRLVPLLVDRGYEIIGATRSPEKAASLKDARAEAVMVDVFDAPALARAVKDSRPEVVIHQLTDLPYGLDPAQMAEARVRNARIRSEGTRNLVEAALAAGAKRLIAQSIAWGYLPGPEPHREDDPLDVDGPQAVTMQGVMALERLTLDSPPIEGVILRYGQIYGPGTGTEERGPIPVHVDAAAYAAALAINRGEPGIYNVAEDCSYLSSKKARNQLGWKENLESKTLQQTADRIFCSPIVP